MDINGWRKRLANSLRDSGKSKRAVSLAAGKGPGYMHSILKEGRDPTIESLSAICFVLGVTTSYILHGTKLSPAQEEFLNLFENAHPDDRQAVLTLLRPRKDGGTH